MSNKSSHKKETEYDLYKLPNGLSIHHLNKHETDFVYNEIFEEKVYLKHGITVNEGDCIFDIGANIGLFSLFLLKKFNNIKIHAFEPSPDLCEIIRLNTAGYDPGVILHQCGISNENKEALFTFYPDYSILSGFNARLDQDKNLLKAGLGELNPAKNRFDELIVDEMVKEKLKQKIEYTCPLKTISHIIREHRLESIDLLKIDAEKSEMDILKGIDAGDWPKVKQLVMEIHDAEGKLLNEIKVLLEEKGFFLQMEQEKNFKESGIVNLYARQEPGPIAAVPVKNREKFVIAATFTIDPLIPGIEFWSRELELPVETRLAPYNQVFQELLSPQSLLRTNSSGMNIILVKFDDWLRYQEEPGDGSKNKNALTRNRQQHMKTTFKEFKQALRTYSEFSSSFTLLLVCPSSPVYAGDSSFKKLMDSFEKELESLIRSLSGLELMKAADYHPWYRIDRKENIFDSFSDELGHIPYKNQYYNFLSTLMMRRFYSLRRKPYKVLALDCDNTLWKGVCGEDGPGGVEIEGLFKKFQQFLIKKSDQGFLLCLSSKNVEEDVWNVFDKNERMVLKRNHIVDTRINWQPKSVNIKGLAQTLNLGLDSFIFVDDNPVECADVRLNCPEALTIQWPLADNNDSFLEHLWILDTFSVTEEDKKRKESYKANVDREKLRGQSYDFKSFIENLNLEITLTPVDAASIPRASQLTQRTNQFNFITIRRSQKQVEDLIAAGTHECWTARVKDRFGDYGIVGLMIAKKDKNLLELDTFLLSCRVLGRGVEYKMMAKLGEMAVNNKKKQVKIVYKKTPKNEPARLFIQHFASGYIGGKDGEDLEIFYPAKELAKVCYTPPRSEDDLPVKAGKKEKEKIPRDNLNDFASVRKTERLVTRIALELSQPADLAREIQGFEEKTSEAAPGPQKEIQPSAGISTSGKEEKELYRRVLEKVKDVFSASLSISRVELDPDTEIENYLQQNSLKIVEITSALNDEFANIQPTLLFEQRTLKSITENIIESSGQVSKSTYLIESQDEEGTAGIESAGVNRAAAREPAAIKVEQRDKAAFGEAEGQNEEKDIAVIGMNGRFPKAGTLREFWENLKAGISLITEVPASRWDADALFDEEGKPGKSYCKWGGFIDDVDSFEASFFHISPREAETMDPQQRIFMEVVWGLLEDAGYTAKTLGRDTGVFVGVIASDYSTYANEATVQGQGAYRNSDYYQIPNRISYFFDFKGPSIAMDTACSSAGTALHLACQSLRRKECSAAVVGGLNLFLHPGRFIQYSQIQVLSRDNKCRPFGENASGTLYGEGIGAILIKPLKAAEKDGDHIYAVIKGSAVNSGGKTNGFTVPNPLAQAEVISRALKDAEVDSRTISYIEAHGTGTPLGDPIEIRGLTKAFRENSTLENHKSYTQYCSIGSVKSNIGHLESGAAMAGIIKILLQMKYGKLAPSLNAEPLNPMIAFDKTPFYVQQTLDDWKPPVIKENGKPVQYSRRAGISTFGAGGVNAHFILEEYPDSRQHSSRESEPHLIVLSAPDPEKLQSQANELAQFLENLPSSSALENSNRFITDLAYTLQVGREEMDERLALVVSSIKELIGKLSRFCRGKTTVEEICTGNAKSLGMPPALLLEGREGKQFIDIIINDGKLEKLAKLWISGVGIDWKLLYRSRTPQRISLPTYKFSGERYWLSGFETNKKISGIGKLHPFADSNESTFEQQCFKKELSREDIFMKNHVINGQMVLPGVAYFEMARVMGNLSNPGGQIKTISNMVWKRPVFLYDTPREVFIHLYPKHRGITCKAITVGESGEKSIHAEWNMSYSENSDTPGVPQENAVVDIPAIKRESSNQLSSDDCYKLLQSIGYNYGPSFKVIKELYYNERQALSFLQLQEKENERVALNPALMDGALQTITGWISQIEGPYPCPYIPFTIGKVKIFKPLEPGCFALVTRSAPKSSPETPIKKYDLTILNENGETFVTIEDYYPRPFQQDSQPVESVETGMFYKSCWQKSDLQLTAPEDDKDDRERGILVFDINHDVQKALKERLNLETANHIPVVLVKPGKSFRAPGNHVYEINPGCEADYGKLFMALDSQKIKPTRILHHWSQDVYTAKTADLSSQLNLGFYSIFYLSRALMSGKIDGNIRLLYVYNNPVGKPQPQYAAVGGLVRSIQRENPRLLFKTLEITNSLPKPAFLVDMTLKEFQDRYDKVQEIKYKNQERFIKETREFEFDKEEGKGNANQAILKEKAVYLITGGAGGLGLIMAQYLAKQYRAKLVLSGRSNPGGDKDKIIEQIRSLGGEAVYIKADVSKRNHVKNLIAQAKIHFKDINGVIHCAGAIRDSLAINKTQSEIDAVLNPKVFGTVLLDEETKKEKLDFFLVFSSISSIIGNLGQSDYSYANRFLDEFTAWRNEGCKENKRTGRTIAINWPWWRNGGMKLDESVEKSLERTIGMKGISNDQGLAVFEKGLNSQENHFIFILGDRRKISLLFENNHKKNKSDLVIHKSAPESHDHIPSMVNSASIQMREVNIHEAVKNDTSKIVNDILKIPPGKIDFNKKVSEFGFDSISFTDFANRINETYDLNISPATFYEYQTLRDFVSFLCEEHQTEISRHYTIAKETGLPGESTGALTGESPELPCRFTKKIEPAVQPGTVGYMNHRQEVINTKELIKEPIAVIGMGGIMPQSEDLDILWKHLENGDDLISEIPLDRWNWEKIYGDPSEETNKTLIKKGGFIKDVDKFDAGFFSISPREAELMDPKQRIFLEVAWKAIEDAGYRPSALTGTNTGVFVGVGVSDYTELLIKGDIPIEPYTSTGCLSNAVVPNRISYLLNLHGPSEPIDTACSSSLVAVHRGIEAIRNGRCDMVIAGGVNVILTPTVHISFNKAGLLAVDGKCKTFDSKADGYVRGEGAGAVVLKSLKKARENRDHIYGVILGSAVNHGGHTSSLTVPNPNAQADLIIKAFEDAGIDPTTVSYIETHGTGTSLGDPIEINGLKKAFNQLYEKWKKPKPGISHCGLGSIKTNIGHLEAAAGIAGLTKVLLNFKHKTLPASIHFEEMNPYCKLEGSPFYIVKETKPWQCLTVNNQPIPRRAGISSFGFGGTNAHIVLEEYESPSLHSPSPDNSPHIILLSAKNKERLKAYARSMVMYLEKAGPSLRLADLAFTLQIGREALEERLAVVVTGINPLKEKLRQYHRCEDELTLKRVYTGNIKESKQKTELSINGKSQEEPVKIIANNKEPDELAQLWVSGVEPDWESLYLDKKPRRISLPTYPFARERYWVPDSNRKPAAETPVPMEDYELIELLEKLENSEMTTSEAMLLTEGRI